jgi:signal transduction histidine kinase
VLVVRLVEEQAALRRVATLVARCSRRVLRVCIRDDGAGGADFGRGTGLAGLTDRVESLGGQIFLDSPRGAGTRLRVELPLTKRSW